MIGLFVLFRLMPGDFTTMLAVRGASPEQIAALEAKWGLNDPVYIQTWRYMINLIQGDVGTSLQYGTPVVEYVRTPLINSIILIAPAITTTYILGSLYGLIAGTNRGSWIETKGIVPIIFVGAFPAFFLSIMLVIIFAGILNWFPTSGMMSAETVSMYKDAPWWRPYLTMDFLWHFILPYVAVILRYLFLPSLIMRTSVVEIKGGAFDFYQRVTGMPKRTRLFNTARLASLPVITLYPVTLSRSIGGLVLIEVVFAWPGIGKTLVDAITFRDFPVVMFVFFLIAAFIIIGNFVVDIIYSILDPRVSVDD
jgi:peptide/nickel transport system permease protein